jgi:hypothetical protein
VILADTSVWVDHFRNGDVRLQEYLEKSLIAIHPFVIGEIALGRLNERRQILGLLRDLPAAEVATHEEAMAAIDAHRLHDRGIGYADAHLLASALLSDLRLWTRDRRLARVAAELSVSAGLA